VISLVGVVALALNKKRLQSMLIFLVSFAVGGLFGDVFIHILPDAFEEASQPLVVSFGVLGGILLFFVLEKIICWRHCHAGDCDLHHKPVIWINLLGDGLHNFIDGAIIAASYSVDFSIGITTTLAVVLHEIPQEIGDFGILVTAGLSRSRALIYNFCCSLTAFAGALLALWIGPKIALFSSLVLPLTAGGFIYLAGSDLIPELHKEMDVRRSLLQLFSVLLGIAMMGVLLWVE
jgi:zinc and cadmium transporter